MRRTVLVIVGTVALAACGGGSGAKLAVPDSASPRTSDSTVASDGSTTTVADTTTTVVVTTTTQPSKMPDLVGATLADAKAELTDLDVADVRITEVEHVTAPGTVLDQVPSAGSRITGPVDLTVTKALPPMAEWAGKLVAEAQTYFDERGVTVTIEEVLDDTVADGTIISSTPAAGQSIGSEVKLSVATTPTTKFLGEYGVVDDCGLQYGDISVNGSTQLDSTYWASHSWGSGSSTCEFDLGRDWSRIKGSIGIWDGSDSALQCRVEIFADGTAVFDQTAWLGMLAPFEIDVTNALRVKIVVTSNRLDGSCVLATARFVGSGSGD